MENIEIWKDIIGYEGKYQISNLGRVKSFNFHRGNREGFLKIKFNTYGYAFISLCINGKVNHKTIHKLLADSFILNPDNKSDVNHKNGDKSDYRIENLEWCTRSENMIHKHRVLGFKSGRFGKKNPNSFFLKKYSHLIGRNNEIYKRLSSGEGAYILAKEYGCSPKTVYNIRKRYNLFTNQ